MYYMNNIGVTKKQSQAAKVNISNIGKNLDDIMNTIKAADLTKEESQKVLVKVLNHDMTIEDAIAEVRPVEVVEAIEAVEVETVEAVAAETVKTREITKIRKAVATLANKINGKIKNLSAAFRKAWAVIKGKTIQSKVAGVSFGNTQKALQQLTKYSPKAVSVELIRENNEHDINAIAVTVSVNNSKTYKIGFLPRDLSQYMAKLIDNGITLITSFKGVTGGTEYYKSYGALIDIKAKGLYSNPLTNRGTFYKHYNDQYGLLNEIQDELDVEISATLEKKLTDSSSGAEIIKEFFRCVAIQSSLCKVLCGDYGDTEFLKKLMYNAHDQFIEEWKTKLKKADIKQLDKFYTYTANGIIAVAQEWLQSDMAESPEEIALFIEKTTNYGLSSFVNDIR